MKKITTEVVVRGSAAAVGLAALVSVVGAGVGLHLQVADRVVRHARQQAIDWLELRGASSQLQDLIARAGHLDTAQQDTIVGEALPKGLRLE